MPYKVLLHPRAAHYLHHLEPKGRQRIKSALEELEESPERKGEQLHASRYWKIRVGDYRAIFELDLKNSAVIVLFIGHRSKVYDDFSRLF